MASYNKDDKAILKRFGSIIRERREELGYSQERLGEHVGLHRTYIGGIERGERNLALLNIIKLAEALKTTPEWIFSKF